VQFILSIFIILFILHFHPAYQTVIHTE